MKVKELIAALLNADPELEVCYFSDLGVMSVENANLCEGSFERPYGRKLINEHCNSKYVGLGSAGDFECTAPNDIVNLIYDLRYNRKI